MPPKVKVSREDIINTAVEIVRNGGVEALNARNIAAVLGCSTQPVFSNFKNMEQLKNEAKKCANNIYLQFVNDLLPNNYSKYKAECMAYICFAKNEKHLFELLYLGENDNGLNYRLEHIVFDTLGLSDDMAKLFNLEMWAFVHGMAVMTANAKFPLHDAVISQIFDDAYEGLKTRFNL